MAAHLTEHDLAGLGGLEDLLDGQTRVRRRDVEDVVLGRTLDETKLAIGVAAEASSTGGDVEGDREVVAQEAGVERLGDAGDVDQLARAPGVAVVDLEVVARTPLAGDTVDVVGVVGRGEVAPGSPLEVGQAHKLGNVGQRAIGSVAENVVDANVGLGNELPGREGATEKSEADERPHVSRYVGEHRCLSPPAYFYFPDEAQEEDYCTF
jgi:hypothetical protein